MNEHHFAYKVRQQLNCGLHELRPDTADRLAAARMGALACQKQLVHQSLLATAGGFVQHYFDQMRYKQLFAALSLLLCAVFSTFWVADQRINELGAIDSAILANDLPIDAFTDKGFDVWLQSSSSQ